MKIKILGGKKIIIRKPSHKDLKDVKKFQDFINSLVQENAKILANKKFSLKEEKAWLLSQLQSVKNKKTVYLIAEVNNTIVGTTGIDFRNGREAHVGEFGIAIKDGYRRIGLGSCLMREIIKLAKKELKPRPKIIRLSVYSVNKPAQGLYKKMGFKSVAKIPKQVSYNGRLVDEIVMLLYL